jgi:hypothetical protein
MNPKTFGTSGRGKNCRVKLPLLFCALTIPTSPTGSLVEKAQPVKVPTGGLNQIGSSHQHVGGINRSKNALDLANSLSTEKL